MAEQHVCPWWVGYFLISPLRKIFQKPEAILGPYVGEGMTVLEVGPGMGFFTIPIAQMVGERGRIICVDVQEKMLKGLQRRARKAGVENRIVMRLASNDSLRVEDYRGCVDFALAFAVMHEVPNPEKLFHEMLEALKPNAVLLISEPTGHVTPENFAETLATAERVGFEMISRPAIKRSHSAVVRKR